MNIDYLDNQGFIQETESIEALKISKSKGYIEDGNFINPSKPDKRYFWDGDKLGLHISDYFQLLDWFSILQNIKEYIPKLKIIYIARTEINTFSSLTYNFKNVEFLNLSDNNWLSYIDLSKFNSLYRFESNNCKTLQKLEFEGNYPFLDHIDISNCDLDEFQCTNSKFDALKYLNISNNKICTFKIISAKNLKYFYGSNNDLYDFEISGVVKELIHVDISNNRNLHKLPEFVKNAKNLEVLKLNKTTIHLKDLEIIRGFRKLVEVTLVETEIEKQYPNDVKEGWSAVKRLLEDDKLPFYHIKVLLLGNTNVGKTDLLYYLKNKKQRKNNTTTHGLEYHEIEFLKKRDEKFNTFLHIWDFGGQEYYHGTHKMFFSGGSINIILWAKIDDLREEQKDECFDLEYWLRCAERLSHDETGIFKTDTLIVENKIDVDKDKYGKKYKFENQQTYLNQKELNEKFGNDMHLDFSHMALKPKGVEIEKPKFFELFKGHLISKIIDKQKDRPKKDVYLYDQIIEEDAAIIPIKDLG